MLLEKETGLQERTVSTYASASPITSTLILEGKMVSTMLIS
jgi:hypothetical protein